MEIRCLVKKEGDLYIAMSLDFGLSAQDSSLERVKSKLEGQIAEYVVEACTVDAQCAKQLLSRKGPVSWFVTFYLAKLHFFSKQIFTFTNHQSDPTHA